MKRIYLKYFILIVCVCLIQSCGKSFLETEPQGSITEEQLSNNKGVEAALTGAYGIMNGNINGTWGNYSSAPSQWLFGEVGSDDAHKGSSNTDQSPMNDIELHRVNSTNDNLPTMWRVYYEGVIRCNTTLRLLSALQSSNASDRFSDERAKQIEAEAKVLRGHYYFFLKRVFNTIPYIDETLSTNDAVNTANDKDIDPQIEADFKFGVDNLSYDKPLGEVGRMDKFAAESYLGKLYLYQKKYSEALVLFKDVITNKPSLSTMPFQNNFNVTTKNGPEGIVVAQNYINKDGSGDNGNVGDMLAGLYGSAPVNCCGFYQPSIDLVNSYKVDANGLPLLDNSYRTNPYVSDLALTGANKTNYQVNVSLAFDPRLDYTVGRRGVPYRDWGVMPGDNWIRDPSFGGPFVAVKQMINEADFGGNTASGALQITSQNINIIRLSDVYLMAAECAVETGDLAYALTMVNAVRARAALLPKVNLNGTASAAYNVKPYTSFTSADYARQAVRFERRLELAMEGHRFYDLVRWGVAKTVLESYQNFEKTYVGSSQTITFDATKDSYFPIPQQEIDRGGGILKPNGYGH